MLDRRALLLTCGLTVLMGVGANLVAQNVKHETKLFEGKLANVPGNTLTAEVVEFPPGYKSEVHHHAGSVFAYVLTGKIRSQNSATGPARVYEAGESFFEPPGSDHLVTENPSTSEPASLLAIHVAKEGAVLTEPGHANQLLRFIGVDVVPEDSRLQPSIASRMFDLRVTGPRARTA